MGLLQNGFRDTIGIFRIYGAGTLNGAYPSTRPGNWHLTGSQRNLTAGEGITADTAAIPMGHLAPSAWMLPQKPGGMSAFTSCRGMGSATASGAEGMGVAGTADGVATADATGIMLFWGSGTAAGYATADGDLLGIAVLVGSAAGSGDASGVLFSLINISGQADGTSTADVSGSLAASISGLSEGSCTAMGAMSALLGMLGTADGIGSAEAVITGGYAISGESAGIGAASAGHLDAYGWLIGAADGTCSAAVQPYAEGSMSGSTATEAGVLTADGVAMAVWMALAADNNTSGTMGNKLNTASSGGVDMDALAEAVWGYER